MTFLSRQLRLTRRKWPNSQEERDQTQPLRLDHQEGVRSNQPALFIICIK